MVCLFKCSFLPRPITGLIPFDRICATLINGANQNLISIACYDGMLTNRRGSLDGYETKRKRNLTNDTQINNKAFGRTLNLGYITGKTGSHKSYSDDVKEDT
jgi:hypothetical protein